MSTVRSSQNTMQMASIASYASTWFRERKQHRTLCDGASSRDDWQCLRPLNLTAGWRCSANRTHLQPSGFSAVLLQRPQTGEKVLAIAGTDPTSPADLITDLVNVALFGTVLGMPQYASLESFYQELLSNGKLGANEQVVVTGHSLGGFLAQAFTARHASVVASAYTYNAPGFGNIEALLGFLGVTDTSAAAKITNVHAVDGMSVVAGLGVLLGASQGVRIEDDPSNPLANHSIVRLGDALAIHNAYASLHPGLSTEQIGSLFLAAGHRERRLEDALDTLRTVFIGSASNDINKTPTGDRDRFYVNLLALQDDVGFKALSGQIRMAQANAGFTSLSQVDSSNALAYRYALLELMPLAAVASTDAQNQTLYGAYSQRLSLYDATTGQGELTRPWLTDRAAMLDWLRLRNSRNVEGVITGGESGRTIIESMNYQDLASGTQLLVGAVDHLNQRRQVLFGGDAADTLVGYGKADHLYGGAGGDSLTGQGGGDHLQGDAGTDTLDGGEGNDQLVGGKGFDTYALEGSFGQDTIQDSDGAGVIKVGALQLAGGKASGAANTYKADGFTYARVANGASVDLVIAQDGTGNRITISGWQAGQLGITLDETLIAPPPVSNTFNGEYAKQIDPNDGTRYVFDSFSNYASSGRAARNRRCALGTASNDVLRGLGGNDALGGWRATTD